jgi:hypothetical protein
MRSSRHLRSFSGTRLQGSFSVLAYGKELDKFMILICSYYMNSAGSRFKLTIPLSHAHLFDPPISARYIQQAIGHVRTLRQQKIVKLYDYFTYRVLLKVNIPWGILKERRPCMTGPPFAIVIERSVSQDYRNPYLMISSPTQKTRPPTF